MSWNTDQRVEPGPNKSFENQENEPSVDERVSIVNSDIERRRLPPSLYHGTWPMDRDLWNGNNENSKLATSVMSFTSNSSTDNNHHLKQENNNDNDEKSDAQMDVTCSLFKMLLADATGREDITKLFKLSNITDNCLTMRKSGCLPLLVELIHAPDQNPKVRHGASLTLFNIVRANQIQPQARQELHVLELVEQLRDYSQHLRGYSDKCKEPFRHPITAMSLLTKLSFNEAHRLIMCEIGGLHAIAEIIVLDHLVHGSKTTDQNCISLRRFAGMNLTNLTFGDSKNKSILCTFGKFIKVWVSQLNSNNDDLHQVTASVLRNLSWRADVVSKRILREMNTVTYLTNAAMKSRREQTLKSILSALWNLSAHCTKNKIDICIVNGALEFLVDMISLNSPTKLPIIENGGGVLRNVSSHIAVEEKYRIILRKKNCIAILVKLLKSSSSTVVSNACGTLWNLSARCPEDQKTLWNLSVVPLLRELANSKHKMISMGASAALRNLLTARNSQSQIFRPINSGQIVKRSIKVSDNCQDNLPSRIIAGCGSRTIEVTAEDETEQHSSSNRSWNSSSPKRPSSPLVSDSEPRDIEKSSKTSIKLEDNLNEDADYDKNHYPEMRKGSPVGSPYFERRRRNNSGPYETDGDQPVDYSQKFIEKNTTKTKQNINNKIKTESDDDENYTNEFGDYAETDLDQPTDYSLRYAEDDTDDEDKQSTRYFTVNEQEDTIKTYCTEGTPYETPFNFSNATSMSDLRLEEIKEGETSKKLIKKQVNGKIKDFKQEKNFIEKKEIDENEEINLNKNDERLEVNSCQEKTVYYYEEGTPGRISPVNSLSSLGSLMENRNDEVIVEVSDETDNQLPKENNTKKNSELPLDLSVEKTPQKQNDKEGKMVTFGGEDHYAEETPLMFSRSSSLGSLSGFEQMSIHDDRSSIISDFSRRTSGVVSPSELPDSPTQTVPPSPRHQKNPIDYSLRNPPRFISTFTKFSNPPVQKTKQSFFEDDTAAFKEESTPIEFSAATSLSSLTIDDDIKSPEISIIEGKFFEICKIKTEHNGQVPKDLSPVAGFLKIKEKEEEIQVKTERENYGHYRDQDQVSDADEEDDEDMLAACINMGMQNNRYRQNLQKNDNKPQAYPTTLVSNLIRYQTSSTLDRLESSVFEPRSGSSPLKTKLNIDISNETDTMHVYCTEDTPADISPVGSHSNLSALSLPSIIEDFEKPDEINQINNEISLSNSSDSSIISGDDGDKILDECIQSGMPKRLSPGLLINPSKSDLTLTRLNSVEESDCCLGLPTGNNEEGFNNSFDDSPNQSDDDAILAECIESGMPKARINISRSLSRSMEKIKGDFVNARDEQRKSSGSEDSLSLSDDEEEEDDLILAQCIRSGMPKASTSASNFPQTLTEDTRRVLNVSLSPPRHFSSRQINMPKSLSPTAAQDEIAGFETEDTPCNFSVVSEFSSLSINSNLD